MRHEPNTSKDVRAERQRRFSFLKVPLVYLGTQAICVGFTLALLFTVGNTTFIVANGADRLPIAYLWIGLVTPLLSIGYNRLQRVWSVSRMGMGGHALTRPMSRQDKSRMLELGESL